MRRIFGMRGRSGVCCRCARALPTRGRVVEPLTPLPCALVDVARFDGVSIDSPSSSVRPSSPASTTAVTAAETRIALQ